jgi:2Fe-2S ferredoxin
MPIIRVLPEGLVLQARPGQTIMEAAWAQGYYWPTTCGGQGICTSCACAVMAGEEALEPMGPSERRTLYGEFGEAQVRARRLRLACQARVRGDVTVQKRGVRPA